MYIILPFDSLHLLIIRYRYSSIVIPILAEKRVVHYATLFMQTSFYKRSSSISLQLLQKCKYAYQKRGFDIRRF